MSSFCSVNSAGCMLTTRAMSIGAPDRPLSEASGARGDLGGGCVVYPTVIGTLPIRIGPSSSGYPHRVRDRQPGHRHGHVRQGGIGSAFLSPALRACVAGATPTA